MIKLREVRKAKGLSQTELANRIAHEYPTVTQMTISVLENGAIYPSEKLRDAICEALECDESDIYDGVEAMFIPAEDVEISETTEQIAMVLRYGKTDRKVLAQLLGVPDRKMRRLIEKARKEGLPVCNEQNGEGYYLADTREDIDRLIRSMYSRAMAILVQISALKRSLRNA